MRGESGLVFGGVFVCCCFFPFIIQTMHSVKIFGCGSTLLYSPGLEAARNTQKHTLSQKRILANFNLGIAVFLKYVDFSTHTPQTHFFFPNNCRGHSMVYAKPDYCILRKLPTQPRGQKIVIIFEKSMNTFIFYYEENS